MVGDVLGSVGAWVLSLFFFFRGGSFLVAVYLLGFSFLPAFGFRQVLGFGSVHVATISLLCTVRVSSCFVFCWSFCSFQCGVVGWFHLHPFSYFLIIFSRSKLGLGCGAGFSEFHLFFLSTRIYLGFLTDGGGVYLLFSKAKKRGVFCFVFLLFVRTSHENLTS